MSASAASARIVSLDQFRGYTVAGMLLVNFIDSYSEVIRLVPTLKHYNTHCSYADTIMPQFFFAVGFAFRLMFLRRVASAGTGAAWGQAVKRSLGLILLGAVIYHLDGRAENWKKLTELGWTGFLSTAFERNLFQTLVHIGVTSLWVLPVIGLGVRPRVFWILFSVVVHLSLSHPDWYPATWGRLFIPWLGWEKSYYEWVTWRPGIDGGPLGFLTWTVPLLVGSLVYDAMHAALERPPLKRFLAWSSALMLLGYGLTCLSTIDPTPAVQYRHEFSKEGPRQDKPVRVPIESATAESPALGLADCPFLRPHGVVNVWTISQRSGSAAYLIFSTGFSLALYVLFIVVCDHWGFTLGVFRTLGTNALAAYIIHDLVDNLVKPWVPNDAPAWFALTGFGIFFSISYLFTRYLEKHGLFLRL